MRRHVPSLLRRGLVAGLLLAAAACGGADLLEPGRFEGRTFIHEGLGLRLPFPDGWSILGEDEAGDLPMKGQGLLTGNDPTGGAYAAAGTPTSRTLFQVYRYPRGSVPGVNPNLLGAVESIAARPQIQTAADYLQMLQTFLEKSGAPMSFEPLVPAAVLGGQEWAVLAVTLQPQPTLRVGQIYHARRVEDSIITIVATFTTPDQWVELEQVLGGMAMER